MSIRTHARNVYNGEDGDFISVRMEGYQVCIDTPYNDISMRLRHHDQLLDIARKLIEAWQDIKAGG